MIYISFTVCLRHVTLQNRSVKIFQQLLIELGDEETLYIQSNGLIILLVRKKNHWSIQNKDM